MPLLTGSPFMKAAQPASTAPRRNASYLQCPDTLAASRGGGSRSAHAQAAWDMQKSKN